MNYLYLFTPAMCLAVSHILLGNPCKCVLWSSERVVRPGMLSVYLNPKLSFKASYTFHSSRNLFCAFRALLTVLLSLLSESLISDLAAIHSFLIQSPNTHKAPTVCQALCWVWPHTSVYFYSIIKINNSPYHVQDQLYIDSCI